MPPSNYSRYFERQYQRDRLLREHGFTDEPSDEDLMRYLFSLDDKLNELATALGYSFTRDICGRTSLCIMKKPSDCECDDDGQES